MARGKTHRKRKERKSRRVIRKTRTHRGGMYSENEREAAQALLAFSRGFYVRKPSTIHIGAKLEYLREHEKGLGILLEPYTIQAKEAGKPRDVMIEEYKALREITKQEFLSDLRILKVSKLEDIYPLIEKVYQQVFNILNNKNPKELVERFDPITLAKIVIYAQEIITYSEKFV
jgi:hypothetical protein